MKKSKILVGLSAAFVSAVALASCSGNITSAGQVILYYDGEAYTAEQLFGKKLETPDGAQAAFNAVYKVAVRNWANTKTGDQLKKQIENETKNKVSSAKADAQANASKSGTSYDEEFKKILTTNGVENEAQLYDKFEYDVQKEKFEDQFYEQNYDVLKNGGYLGKGVEKKPDPTDPEYNEKYIKYVKGFLNSKAPYHMKHILVKTPKADKSNYVTGEIEEATAGKISTIVKELAEGRSFGEVAFDHSEDDAANGGSKQKYGDVGIMDLDTNFVDEFKLGTYMYESFFGSSTQKKTTTGDWNSLIAKDELKLAEENDFSNTENGTATYYASELNKFNDPSSYKYYNDQDPQTLVDDYTGIGVIPYQAAELLGKWKHIDYKTQNLSAVNANESATKYIPRNVLFNKYFNRHNISVIVPTKLSVNSDLSDPDTGNNNMKTLLNDVTGEGGTTPKYISGEAYNEKIEKPEKYKGIVESDYKSKTGFSTTNIKNEDVLVKNNLTGTSPSYSNIKISLCDDTGTEDGKYNNVLRDTEGRVIFVVRGNDGVHFICIQRSPFITKETESAATSETVTDPGVSLEEYYTIAYPGDSEHKYPQYTPKTGTTPIDKTTYVNHISGLKTVDLKKRADEVKAKLKAADPNLTKHIFQYLDEQNSFSFVGKGVDIKKAIDNWIEISIKSTDYDNKETWNKAWQTYYYKLEEQLIQRKWNDDEGTSALVPDVCAFAFAYATVGDISEESKENILCKKDCQTIFGPGGIFNEK